MDTKHSQDRQNPQKVHIVGDKRKGLESSASKGVSELALTVAIV